MSDDDVKLGYIGLGNMGAPMAKRLVDWPGGLTVFDVRTEAMTPFAEAGATLADSVADVAAADIISVTVLNDAQVRDVVGELAAHAKPGTVIAIHSTISADTAVELADSCRPQGIHVVDAPVSGGAVRPKKGELAVMVGADRRGVRAGQAGRSQQWASLVVHAGEPGAGTRMKLARNMLTFIGFAAACEALKLAEAAGIDLQQLGRVVRHTDALTGGPGAIMVRDDMTTARSPTTSCTSPSPTPAGSARRISAWRWRWARRSASTCRWPNWRCENLAAGPRCAAHRVDHEGVSHGRTAQQGPREDERGLRLGDAEHARATILRAHRRSPLRHHLEPARPVDARQADDAARRADRARAWRTWPEIQVNAALHNEELTRDELKEMAIFLTHYVGFPLGSKLDGAFKAWSPNARRPRRRATARDKKDNVNAAVKMHVGRNTHDK